MFLIVCIHYVIALFHEWFIAISKSHGSIFRLSPLTIHGTVLCFHLDLPFTFVGTRDSQFQVLRSSPFSGYNVNSFSTPIMLGFMTPPSFCCPPILSFAARVDESDNHTRCIRSTAYGCVEHSHWHPSRQLCTNWVLYSSECTWAHNSFLWHETCYLSPCVLSRNSVDFHESLELVVDKSLPMPDTHTLSL